MHVHYAILAEDRVHCQLCDCTLSNKCPCPCRQLYISTVYMQCWADVYLMCRTAEAFTRRLGVLGVDLQAERMLHAFVSRGLELRLQDIKYHAQGQDHEVESLTGISSKGSDAEASQVIFHSLC